jgi:hypothetical protein
MSWIDQWLNKEEVKKALGVPLEREFESEYSTIAIFIS